MNSNQLLCRTYQHLTRLLKWFMMLTNTKGSGPHTVHCTNTNHMVLYYANLASEIPILSIKLILNHHRMLNVGCLNCNSFDEVFISRNLLPECRYQFSWNDKIPVNHFIFPINHLYVWMLQNFVCEIFCLCCPRSFTN